MSEASRVVVAVLVILVVAIEVGGRFLLSVLSGAQPGIDRGSLQFSLFRAGHAHAGVLVILAIAVMPYIDAIPGGDGFQTAVRACFVAAPLLISGGMFGAGRLRDGKPGALVALVYAGAVVLAVGLVALGVGLLRAA